MRAPVRSWTTCEKSGSWPTTQDALVLAGGAQQRASPRATSKPSRSGSCTTGSQPSASHASFAVSTRADLRAREHVLERRRRAPPARARPRATGRARARSARGRRRPSRRAARPRRAAGATAAAPSQQRKASRRYGRLSRGPAASRRRPRQPVAAPAAVRRAEREVAARVRLTVFSRLNLRMPRVLVEHVSGRRAGRGPDEPPQRHPRAVAQRREREAEAGERGLLARRSRSAGRTRSRRSARWRDALARQVVAQQVLRERLDAACSSRRSARRSRGTRAAGRARRRATRSGVDWIPNSVR